MVVLERPVRFQDVDPAGIVFFAHFSTYAHEAMEAFFGALHGGYPGLITKRRIGFPAVKLETEFFAPLRYGDVVRIETSVARLGNRSAVLRYRMSCRDQRIAELLHTVVVSDLARMESCDMPADVRQVLEAHREEVDETSV